MAPRRPRARDPSTDGIEEQVVTQHRRTREDVSDDNDSTEAQQSRRRLTKKPSQVRPSKATTSARASTSRRKSTRKDSSASENEDTPASRIDVANFRDQPIPSKESEKVNRLAGDWESVLKTIKSTALTLAVEAAAGMAEAGLGKDGDDVSNVLSQGVVRRSVEVRTGSRHLKNWKRSRQQCVNFSMSKPSSRHTSLHLRTSLTALRLVKRL